MNEYFNEKNYTIALMMMTLMMPTIPAIFMMIKKDLITFWKIIQVKILAFLQEQKKMWKGNSKVTYKSGSEIQIKSKANTT